MAYRIVGYQGNDFGFDAECDVLDLVPERTSTLECEKTVNYVVIDTETRETWHACSDHKELIVLRGIAA